MNQLGLVRADSLFLEILPGRKLNMPAKKPQIRETDGKDKGKGDISFHCKLRSSGKVRGSERQTDRILLILISLSNDITRTMAKLYDYWNV
jgi:hypothetical protein